MQNSKLIKLLHTFSVREMRLFGEFIESPFYNKNQNVIRFATYIRQHYPKFNSSELNKEIAFSNLFPNEPFNHQRIRDLISMTLALAEEFLITLHFQNNKMQQQIALLRQLYNRNAENLFEMRLAESWKIAATTDNRLRNFYDKYQLQSTEFSYKTRKYFGNEKKSAIYYNHAPLIKTLTQYYLYQVMTDYALWENAGTTTANQDTSFDSVSDALMLLNKSIGGDDVIIQLYFLSIKMIKTKNASYFLKLKNTLCDSKFNAIATDEQLGFLVMLSNFCADKSTAGDYNYLQHAFDIHRTILNRNLHLQNGYISHIFFSNVVINCIRCKEIKWAENFITKYQALLQPKYKESTINYCKAQLAFNTKNYRQALKYLSQSHDGQARRELNIKALTLMIYYELADLDAQLHLIDTWKHSLKNRKDLPHTIFDAHQLFIKQMKKLIQLNENNRTNKLLIKKFTAELKKLPQLIYVYWLIEKTNMLNAKP